MTCIITTYEHSHEISIILSSVYFSAQFWYQGRKMSKYSVKNRWLNKCLGGLAIRFIQSWLVQTDQSCGAFHPSLPCSRGITLSGLSASSGNTCLSSLSAPALGFTQDAGDTLCTLQVLVGSVWLRRMKLSMAVYWERQSGAGLRERDHKPEPHLLPRLTSLYLFMLQFLHLFVERSDTWYLALRVSGTSL